MKCQICRENNAYIVFTKIVNNEKIVLHICYECARKKGLTINMGQSDSYHPEDVPVSHPEQIEKQDDPPVPDITCSGCGLRYEEFRVAGFFGCDQCHEAFGKYIVNLLKQIHGSVVHEGKTPLTLSGEMDLKKHIRSLRTRLQRCIESEDYERAAELRDKIATIERKLLHHEI